MEKKFKYYIQCPATKDEFEDISKHLEDLGYKNSGGTDGGLTIYPNKVEEGYKQSKPAFQRITLLNMQYWDFTVRLNEFNKPLIVALASMTENEEFFKGEYVIFPNGYPKWIEPNIPVPIDRVYDNDYQGPVSIIVATHKSKVGMIGGFRHHDPFYPFRKATKEELIAHFTKEKSFVLPEKWYVRRYPENAKRFNSIFNEYLGDSYCPVYFTTDSPRFAHDDDLAVVRSDKMYTALCLKTSNFIHGFTEITLDQFEEFIPKSNTKKLTMEKKIIGYKLKDQKYKTAASLIVYGNKNCSDMLSSYIPFDHYHIKALEDNEVLNLWFVPVYQEDVVELAGYKLGKTEDGDYKFGCFVTTEENIHWLKSLLNKEEAEAILTIKGKRITIETLNTILKYA